MAQRESELVARAIDYLKEHHARRVTREDVARHVGVSGRHLDRLFKIVTGAAPLTHLNAYRIQRAQALLLETNRSFMDIGLAVGFSGGSRFAEIFRRVTGHSPTEFRRMSQRR